MKTFRTTILILLIPLLVLTIIADFVDQDSFVLPNQQIIAPQDDLSPQYDRHHPSPVIHSRLPSGEALFPVFRLVPIADSPRPAFRRPCSSS